MDNTNIVQMASRVWLRQRDFNEYMFQICMLLFNFCLKISLERHKLFLSFTRRCGSVCQKIPASFCMKLTSTKSHTRSNGCQYV